MLHWGMFLYFTYTRKNYCVYCENIAPWSYFCGDRIFFSNYSNLHEICTWIVFDTVRAVAVDVPDLKTKTLTIILFDPFFEQKKFFWRDVMSKTV